MNVVKKLPEKKATDPLIKFVRAGAGMCKSSVTKLRGILGLARDWECDFDLPEFRSPLSKYLFPPEVCATPLKMDGYVMSRKHRICVGIELTVPMEHNIAKWHQSKLLKYENELRIEAERNNWTFHSCVVEVGARGWIPPSLISSLNKLGLPSVKNLSNDLSLLAMKSSYLIWLNRFNREFCPWRLRVQRSSPLRSTSGVAIGVSSPSTRADGPSSSKQVITTGGAKSESKQMDAASHNGLNGTLAAWPEKRVLVEGKWLRDGKRSDNRVPESGQAATANVESYESLHKMVQGFIKDIDEKKQIPVDPTAAAVSDVDLPTLREEADILMTKMLSILSEPLLPENL